jgi:hypothetical protein
MSAPARRTRSSRRDSRCASSRRATRKLGPSSLEHHPDGSVSIEGEKVDDPEKYKGERLPDAPEPADG